MNAEKSTEQKVERLEYKVEDLERWKLVVQDENLAKTFALAEAQSARMASDVGEMKTDLRALMILSQRSIGFASKARTIAVVGVGSALLIGGFLLQIYVTLTGG